MGHLEDKRNLIYVFIEEAYFTLIVDMLLFLFVKIRYSKQKKQNA